MEGADVAQRQVLEVSGKGVIDSRIDDDAVGATAAQFDDDIGGIVDDVHIITDQALQRVGSGAAIDRVIEEGADQPVHARVALDLEAQGEAHIGEGGIDVDRCQAGAIGCQAGAGADHQALNAAESLGDTQIVDGSDDDVVGHGLGEAHLVNGQAIADAEAGALVDQLQLGEAVVGEVLEGEQGGAFDDVDVVALAAVHIVAAAESGATGSGDQDVVATFAQHFVPATAAIHGVVATGAVHDIVDRGHGNGQLRIEHTGDEDAVAAVHQIVTGTTVHGVGILAAIHAVVAIATEHQVKADAATNGVIAEFAVEHVVLATAIDDVVAITGVEEVNATFAVEGVVAGFAIDGVVAAAAGDHIGEGGADDHLAGVADAIGIEHAASIDIAAWIANVDLVSSSGSDITGTAEGGKDQVASGVKYLLSRGGGLQGCQGCHPGWLARIRHLDPLIGNGEDVGIQVLGAGVAHHQIRHQRAVDAFVEELGSRYPAQVIEVVATL